MILSMLIVLLLASGASPITIHNGYIRSSWVGRDVSKLEYLDPEGHRNGYYVGLSHSIGLSQWSRLRLGIAHAERGNRAIPFRAPGIKISQKGVEPPHDGPYFMENLGHNIEAIESCPVSGSLERGKCMSLAGPYLGIRYSCEERTALAPEDCGSISYVDPGIAYGVGARREVYRGLVLSPEVVAYWMF